MWHEARKQERRIRGLIVDYRRRAERRQDFYEKIQADPTQFIQIHGRRCKIHLDPAVSAAGDGAAIIVPWQGQHDNLIDRFDVRAHLDYIPAIPKSSESVIDISQDERQCNYERYRILAQNDFLNVPEEKFLHQLYLEEQFGVNATFESQSNQSKKKAQKSGAAIGYSYDDATENAQESQPFSHLKMSTPSGIAGGPLAGSVGATIMKTENDSESDSDSDMDMDVSIEVSKLDTNQAHELNACGRNYGMLSNDFYSYLTKDADEADALRLAREEEREKILLGGRKSRRERRAQKERRIARRPFSPPSYAAKEDNIGKEEDSDSRSASPSDTTEKITYITSFGGEDELQPHSKITITLGKGSSTLGAACVGASTSSAPGQTTYAQKVKENLEKLKELNATSKRRGSRSYSRSRSHSRTVKRSRRSVHRTRSRSASYKRHRRFDKRSTSRSRTRSRSRSANKLRSIYSRRHKESYKRSRTRSHSRSHSKSRARRRHKSSSSSTDRRSVSPLRTNYKSTRKSKWSPKSNLSLRPKSRSSSHSNTMRGKTADIKEELKSSNKPMEKISTKQTEILMPSETSTSPLKIAVTNTFPPVPTPIESGVTKQSSPIINVIEPPPPPLKRYYGRKKDEYSSENNSESDNDDELNITQVLKTREVTDTQDQMDVDTTSEKSNPLPSTSVSSYKGKPQQTGKYGSNTSNSNAPETKGSSASGAGVSSSTRLNLRERLKRKMQNLLNKQYKADKKAEIEKTERERQLQQEREEEMRELSIKLRRRQRELRHRYGSQNSKESESGNSDTALTTKSKRSKSRSSERSSIKTSRRRSDEHKRTIKSPLTVKRSSSRERRQSPSRSCRNLRSRSQSHSRRSSSKRRRRSVSRSRRHREPSYERSSRYNIDRSRFDDRLRRSTSRSERDRDRDRDHRIRYRDRDRYSDRQRYWGASDRHRSDRGSDGRERSDRDRYRDRQQPISSTTTSSTSAGTTSRSRVVISAPPKLKKLVDY